jgi:hypothetical protein
MTNELEDFYMPVMCTFGVFQAICLFYFVLLGFELRALCLVGQHAYHLSHAPTLFV